MAMEVEFVEMRWANGKRPVLQIGPGTGVRFNVSHTQNARISGNYLPV